MTIDFGPYGAEPTPNIGEQAGLAPLDAVLTKAEQARKAKNWSAAADLWAELLRRFHGKARPVWYLGLGDALLELRRPGAAEKVFTEGATRFPRAVGLQAALARVASATRDWPLAAERWQSCIDGFPDEVRPHWLIAHGTALLSCGSLDQAEHVLEDAMKRFPDQRRAFVTHARVAAERQDWADCADRWRAIIAAFPDQDLPENGLGLSRALRMAGRFDEADSVLHDYIASHPKDPELWMALATNAHVARDFDLRARRWADALEKFPAKVADSALYKAFQLDAQTGEDVSDDYDFDPSLSESAALARVNSLSAHLLVLEAADLIGRYHRLYPENPKIGAKYMRALSRQLTSQERLDQLLEGTALLCAVEPHNRQAKKERALALINANDADGLRALLDAMARHLRPGADTDVMRTRLPAAPGDAAAAPRPSPHPPRTTYHPPPPAP
ncbi:MAG: tetratricopeptide repeat protein, partial [Rhodobacteraceae bacterium]|nr:tetratricopeptide repeat protein [Paracoccaceae bacterium]